MFSISTGEPPTPPSSTSDPVPSDSDRTSTRSRTGTDSGYEASPCSIADTATNFFGESSGEVFDDFVLLDPSEEDDESSATVLEADDCGDDSDSSADYQMAPRPSSLPIRIPRPDRPTRRPMTDSSSALTNVPSRAAPVAASAPVFPVASSMFRTVFPFRIGHPRSCPAMASWMAENPLARLASHMERLRRRASLHEQRRRRLQIDSDACSDIDTSDDNFLSDDGLEDEVFPMSGDDALVPRLLPDIVLHSPSSSVFRRFRSASVNLPPQPEVLQNIGSALRRLSDQFEVRRCTSRRRRKTIGSFDLR